MITITSNGNWLQVTIKTGLWKANNQEVTTSLDCGSPMFAELLEKKLNDKLETLIEDIRKREYNDGLRDGRAKRKKRDYFWITLKDEKYS